MKDVLSWYRGSRLVIEEFAADSSGWAKCPKGGSSAFMPTATRLIVNLHASSEQAGALHVVQYPLPDAVRCCRIRSLSVIMSMRSTTTGFVLLTEANAFDGGASVLSLNHEL